MALDSRLDRAGPGGILLTARREPKTIVDDHENWRGRCLNLIPSENLMSPQARSLLASDMGHRYTLQGIKEMDGRIVENAYRGTRYLDEVEELARDLACEIYGCRYACVRPLSGHVSAMIALASVCKRDDLIMAVEFAKGGYPGYDPEEMAGLLGLDAIYLPFEDEQCDLNYDSTIGMIGKSTPKAVVLGASKMLFPPRIELLRSACTEAGSSLLYDASHVLGLLGGGKFGKPFDEGVDLIYGSTHKTLFGPQGGMILTDSKDIATSVEDNLHWKTLDNAHWNRIACLAQALLEMKEFGHAYAEQVIKNAQHLAGALDQKGFPVQCRDRGYTRSHQVGLNAVDVAKASGAGTFEEVAKDLENADIIVDCVARLGTCEVTRLGMREREMEAIADLITRLLVEGEDATTVRDEVHGLRFRFRKVEFSFA